MTEQIKFQAEGTCVYALEHDSWRQGKELMRNRVYANVQGHRDVLKEELEATAKLFAAAPEMLQALKACANYEIPFELADIIDAVITKALGN